MKRILVLACMVMLFLSFSSGLFALAEGNDRFAVEIDPLLVFFKILHASVHVAVSDVISIPVFYTGCQLYEDISMHSFSAGVRIYPAAKVHSGFYIGPFLNYNRMANASEKKGFFGYGLELGGMISIGSSFFFDLGAGVVRYDTSGTSIDIPVILPVFNMGFGVKF